MGIADILFNDAELSVLIDNTPAESQMWSLMKISQAVLEKKFKY